MGDGTANQERGGGELALDSREGGAKILQHRDPFYWLVGPVVTWLAKTL